MAATAICGERSIPNCRSPGGYHLISLPKDGSKFGHHAFADLSPEWEMFTAIPLDCCESRRGLVATLCEARDPAPQPARPAQKPKPGPGEGEMPKPRRPARKSTVSAVDDLWRPQQQRRSLCRSLCSSSIAGDLDRHVARRAQMTEILRATDYIVRGRHC